MLSRYPKSKGDAKDVSLIAKCADLQLKRDELAKQVAMVTCFTWDCFLEPSEFSVRVQNQLRTFP